MLVIPNVLFVRNVCWLTNPAALDIADGKANKQITERAEWGGVVALDDHPSRDML